MSASPLKGAHIPEKKFIELLNLFSQDLTAIQIANITGLSRVTVNQYLKKIRERIAWQCESLYGRPGIPGERPVTHLFGILRIDHNFVAIPVMEKQENSGSLPYLAIADFKEWKLYRMPAKPAGDKRPVVDELSGFWGLSKNRLQKFRGLQKPAVYLHVKECEFRYNNRQQNLQQLLIRLLLNG